MTDWDFHSCWIHIGFFFFHHLVLIWTHLTNVNFLFCWNHLLCIWICLCVLFLYSGFNLRNSGKRVNIWKYNRLMCISYFPPFFYRLKELIPEGNKMIFSWVLQNTAHVSVGKKPWTHTRIHTKRSQTLLQANHGAFVEQSGSRLSMSCKLLFERFHLTHSTDAYHLNLWSYLCFFHFADSKKAWASLNRSQQTSSVLLQFIVIPPEYKAS